MNASVNQPRQARVTASPRARRVMKELNIDPAIVHGTGPKGRIIEVDVRRATEVTNLAVAGTRPSGEISPMRRAVAAKVTESFATVPHFYLRSAVDVTALVQLREQVIQTIEQCCGRRPSLTDFLLRAIALALCRCPHANCIWQNDSILQLPSVDVGLVVQVDDGLMVPILHHADRLTLPELVCARESMIAALRSSKAPSDLFQGGATALTNLGRRRVDDFAPIISLPQSSMLAVGRVAERPAVFEGHLCLRQVLHLTLAVDHRVMDGVPAAEFLDRIAEFLEKPSLLLCETPTIHTDEISHDNLPTHER